MEIGKLPNSLLKKLILDKLGSNRKEILVRPGIGEDCAAVDFGEEVCLLSSDPITGAVNEVGKLAVNISCNDIAAGGAESLGIMITLLAPPTITETELGEVMQQIGAEASRLGIDVIGGHTEITDSVTRLVVVTTAIGRKSKRSMTSSNIVQPGNDIVMTKTAGLEGTAIIAADKHSELESLIGKAAVDEATKMIDNISVVKDGSIAASLGYCSMHDVTEGGVLGAVWELAAASGCGVEIHEENIPIAEVTRKICRHYRIDPLRLISSGCLLIICQNGKRMAEALEDSGIRASIIGQITNSNKSILLKGKERHYINEPGSDELYKVVCKA